MSAIYEAHLRMLSTLPVRTHEQRPEQRENPTGRPPVKTTEVRRHRIRELIAAGVKKRHMGDIIGISRTAIQKHLRAIKRGR